MMMNILLDCSDEQPSSPVDQEWKCRGCGFDNKSRNKKCETCDAPKAMRQCFETRVNRTKREPSHSPPGRRSRSPSEETMYSPAENNRKPTHSSKSFFSIYQQ